MLLNSELKGPYFDLAQDLLVACDATLAVRHRHDHALTLDQRLVAWHANVAVLADRGDEMLLGVVVAEFALLR